MLLIYGTIWFIIGLGVPGETPSAAYYAHVFHLMLPDALRMFMWCSTGLVALAVAFRPKGVGDALGWVALYLPPSVRAISFFVAWADYMLPLGAGGYARGWVSASVYAVIVLSIYILSGWPEPPLKRYVAESEKRHDLAIYRSDLIAQQTKHCPLEQGPERKTPQT